MEFLRELLTSEAVLGIAGTLIAAVWARIRLVEIGINLDHEKAAKAFTIIEAAVENTWNAYVREIKAGRVEGKLTNEERLRACEIARTRAVREAHDIGINIVELYGETWIDFAIKQAISVAKRQKANEGGNSK